MKPSQNVVCIIPDTGERYLSKHHSDEWMREKRMLGPERASIRLIKDTKPDGLPDLISVSPQSYVKDVLRLMNEYDVSLIPVIDVDESVGSFRENKILGLVLSDPEVMDRVVTEVMDEPFPVIDEDNNVENAAKLLKKAAAAIIKDRNKLVGIITRFDVLEFTTTLE